MISGRTRLLTIIGHPVAQVRLPSVLNRRFAEGDQDLAMVALDLRAEAVAPFVESLRGAANVIGTVVTVPHKQAVAALLDELTPRAQALGAVNVVRRESDGSLHGDQVDGLGFLQAARAHGFAAAGRQALVVGAGGAGSAIADALCEAGIAVLTLLDHDDNRADRLARVLAERHPGVSLRTRADSLAGLDLLAQVTPAGMAAHDALPLPAELLDSLAPHTLVADAVTVPVTTPLLALAAARGCRVQTGVEMAEASVDFIAAFLRLPAALR